jgi:C7-cyclitol 7-kinase
MSSPGIAVFDVGGTNLRGALYHAEGDRISREIRRPTRSRWDHPDSSPRLLQDELLRALRELTEAIAGDRPQALAVAFPGPVDARGRVLAAPTVWGPPAGEPFELQAVLQGLWPSAAVSVLNDLSAAGYRYLDPEHPDLCLVTVSSGIGHKLFLDGRPVVGRGGRGGEIGHHRVDPSPYAPLCECGGRGHLGALASGRGVLDLAWREARRDRDGFTRSALAPLVAGEPEAVDTHAIAQAFRAGDAWTSAVVARGAEPLGLALAGLHTAVGVERFVVIGGFALALGEPYRRLLVEAARGGCWDLGQDWDEMIRLGCDDDRSGLIGAGRYAQTAQRGH